MKHSEQTIPCNYFRIIIFVKHACICVITIAMFTSRRGTSCREPAGKLSVWLPPISILILVPITIIISDKHLRIVCSNFSDSNEMESLFSLKYSTFNSLCNQFPLLLQDESHLHSQTVQHTSSKYLTRSFGLAIGHYFELN